MFSPALASARWQHCLDTPGGCRSLPGRVSGTRAAGCRLTLTAMPAAHALPPVAHAAHISYVVSRQLFRKAHRCMNDRQQHTRDVVLTAELTASSWRLRLLRQAGAGIAGGTCGKRPLKLRRQGCAGGPCRHQPADMACKLSHSRASVAQLAVMNTQRQLHLPGRVVSHRRHFQPCCKLLAAVLHLQPCNKSMPMRYANMLWRLANED